MTKTPEPMNLFDGDDAESRETPSDAPEAAVEDTEPQPESPDADAPVSDAAPLDATAVHDAALDDVVPEAAEEPHAEEHVAASSPEHAVASAEEMDAWLAAGDGAESSAWMASDSQADAAMAAWIAADPNAVAAQEGPVVVSGGRLERLRPKRRPLVPAWLVWVVLGLLLVAGIAAGSYAFLAVRARVLVPTVAGLQTDAARERLATVGLKLAVADRRFSTLPVDTILSQDPEAGAKLRRGGTVTVVVSAGTEEFTMPDVVGQGLSLARRQLEQKNLRVQVQPMPSDQPSDTVLASNPAAGSTVHTGDTVTLTVASTSTTSTSTTSTSTLVPYTLTAVRITLDPAAPVAGQPDVALDVTRRLQSLLEASGATVISTRSIADTGTTTSATARQARARENSATVAIGFDVISTGAAGVTLTYPSSTVATAVAAPSQLLSSRISSALAGQGITARQAAGGSDVVLSVTGAPYLRETLGSTASPADLANFRDPTWIDKVARAFYQGIASAYGVRNPAAP